ncbi:hypothetical protein ASPBRDRAFT_43387 [Aspergillus brasiliensis CBS 101740]|uniref:Uncharacterized protein n=1 Tax=Aspergillus brasiliensis (strain CBS 101740 / IMI 381727 / IBT 21946) TaxID=767769 RepID=A0A1L9UJZ3_ASPBC|nr:hypothetical protein ASPBRDRAFT_43387 [Aspergillus brasiliensis CBS 101740]
MSERPGKRLKAARNASLDSNVPESQHVEIVSSEHDAPPSGSGGLTARRGAIMSKAARQLHGLPAMEPVSQTSNRTRPPPSTTRRSQPYEPGAQPDIATTSNNEPQTGAPERPQVQGEHKQIQPVQRDEILTRPPVSTLPYPTSTLAPQDRQYPRQVPAAEMVSPTQPGTGEGHKYSSYKRPTIFTQAPKNRVHPPKPYTKGHTQFLERTLKMLSGHDGPPQEELNPNCELGMPPNEYMVHEPPFTADDTPFSNNGECKWIWIVVTLLVLSMFLCLFLYVFKVIR